MRYKVHRKDLSEKKGLKIPEYGKSSKVAPKKREGTGAQGPAPSVQKVLDTSTVTTRGRQVIVIRRDDRQWPVFLGDFYSLWEVIDKTIF